MVGCCPREAIIGLLRTHPEGLTLSSLASLAGMHRHTATKYFYELRGANLVVERDIGPAKLVYLREGLTRNRELSVLTRLNGKIRGVIDSRMKSTLGQVQIFAFITFLLLVPATIIIAQNATNVTHVNISAITGSMSSDDGATILLGENYSELVASVTNGSNLTEEVIIPVEVNETLVPGTSLNVEIFSPDNLTRDRPFEAGVNVSNTGVAAAQSVRIRWVLPEGFSLLYGQEEYDCGDLAAGAECTNKVTITTGYNASLGEGVLRVEVRYG
jgi:AraC-like DNA-binding protein